MLKPRKRKKAIYIMRAIDGSVVGYRGDKRIPIPQESIDGILLIYKPEMFYPIAPKIINGVLELVRKGHVKAT